MLKGKRAKLTDKRAVPSVSERPTAAIEQQCTISKHSDFEPRVTRALRKETNLQLLPELEPPRRKTARPKAPTNQAQVGIPREESISGNNSGLRKPPGPSTKSVHVVKKSNPRSKTFQRSPERKSRRLQKLPPEIDPTRSDPPDPEPSRVSYLNYNPGSDRD